MTFEMDCRSTSYAEEIGDLRGVRAWKWLRNNKIDEWAAKCCPDGPG